jgi:uncharacterized membrane protein YfcA
VDWKIALPFGLASIPAAFFGAYLLIHFEDLIISEYTMNNSVFEIKLMNLIFGGLLIVFAVLELIPSFTLPLNRKFLWAGGLISGFFGGISGHQGALRTAFLTKYKLDKEVFIATGIVIALAVDIARSTEYFIFMDYSVIKSNLHLIFASLLAAFAGAVTGKYFLKKIDLKILTVIIAIAMIAFGIALGAGFLS